MKCGLILVACLLVLSQTTDAGAQPPLPPVTVRTLLEEMTNLRALAAFPHPAYVTCQASSYDRASVTPGGEGWFGNGDAGHFLRIEQVDGRTEHVMMDAKGPGAIVRIWSANPGGTLRFYLDDDERPTFEADMTELLDGQVAHIPPPLAGVSSRGHNLYFPIPYARRCKITVSPGEGMFYHVNYRTYPDGTQVASFDPAALDALRPAIDRVVRQLVDPRDAGARPQHTQAVDLTIAPGQTVVLAAYDAPAAISEILLRLETPASGSDREQALRHLLLTATFDGQPTIRVPLDHFFGSSPGINPYASLPAGMTADGQMWAHWIMPFARSARLTLQNLGPAPAALRGHVGTISHTWSAERSMHFHADFHVRNRLPTRPHMDWTALDARGGPGLFTGLHLSIDNPVREWWGEGDEKVYVDSESFPSTFGTGTEDYFGYAWCDPTPFTHAYHNQTRCDGPDNYGRTSVNRFHILDAMPFTEDFRFDLEILHTRACDVNIATTAYWYGRPGTASDAPAYSATDLAVRPLPPREIFRVKGAIEGEQMGIISQVGDFVPQEIGQASNEHHLWWRNGQKPGDQLILSFDAPRPGRYRILARCLKARDYGIHTLSINADAPTPPIDFYNDGVVLTGVIDLGTHTLRQNDNRLTVTVAGANDKAVKAYMFGLDYVLLEPAE